jgi:hypothetical protein
MRFRRDRRLCLKLLANLRQKLLILAGECLVYRLKVTLRVIKEPVAAIGSID